MADEPLSPESTITAPTKGQTALQAAVTSALVGLFALIADPTASKALGILAPFLSIVLTQVFTWIIRIKAEEWEVERKAEIPVRRLKKYLRELRKEAAALPADSAQRADAEARIRQLSERLHAIQLREVELNITPPTGPPPGEITA